MVVLDLKVGKAWRVLSDDLSTQFEKEVVVHVDGKPLRRLTAGNRNSMLTASRFRTMARRSIGKH
ncbi:hypothetical protein [Neorhizobium petrolearium]|uniref:hypothetical protein n=1 Tax=Neorhizobium petrolearium TaxID=515361 RepID=UPI003F5CEE15